MSLLDHLNPKLPTRLTQLLGTDWAIMGNRHECISILFFSWHLSPFILRCYNSHLKHTVFKFLSFDLSFFLIGKEYFFFSLYLSTPSNLTGCLPYHPNDQVNDLNFGGIFFSNQNRKSRNGNTK